ncbi:hypothetical protein [Pseudoclavibacter sp. JSM 162008]|uniref:hypothetical protein n=1 Tax=Pseudoclavibacter sp. JSM 162008 TaxID=3229855 RepID=UPI0035264BD8
MSANIPQDTTTASTFDRRTALRAAAWSTPVIVFAAAAPARATSQPDVVPGLNGWILFSVKQVQVRVRGRWGWEWETQRVVSLDATGEYPKRGLWVNDVTSRTKLTDIHIVFHLEVDAGAPVFTKSGNASWTDLTLVGTTRIGRTTFNSYRSDFTGTPSRTGARALIDNNFGFVSGAVQKQDPTRYIDRFVTIDGEVFSFRRLVGGNNELLPTTPYVAGGSQRSRLSAAPDAQASVPETETAPSGEASASPGAPEEELVLLESIA